MEQSGFVVGIDLGTSKIVGLMGRKNEQGVISILASESIPSDNCIKYGVIYNIDEAAGKIKKIISLLENKSGRKIGKVYVAVSGKSLRAIEHSIFKDLGSEQEVTFSLIDQMEYQARLNKPEFLTNYSVVAPEIYLDGKYEEDPIGKIATTVEGKYRLVVGRPNIKSNLSKCITEKNQIEIAGFVVGPVASAAIVLDESEKQAGCAFIEFGAGTTTLSIYKGGLLRYMVVIPFGGRTITKDVKELGFVESAAELYKIKYGRVGKDKNKKISSSTNSEIDVRELNKVIQLREEEIILNLISQIKESGYAGQLDAGIIMVGGASKLTGLAEFLEEKIQMPVRKGSAKRLYINNVTDLLQNPAYTQSLGLLLFANENCEKKEIPVPEPEPVEVQVEAVPVGVENAEPVQQHTSQQQRQVQETNTRNSRYAVDDEEEDDEEEIEERPRKNKKKKSSGGLFDFFGKIQNLGGTMFKDED